MKTRNKHWGRPFQDALLFLCGIVKGVMSFLFFINIVALLFSFFVAGALLGAIFSKPARKKLAKLLQLKHFQRLLLKEINS